MDVIGFQYHWMAAQSSFMTVQRLISVVKMAMVLEVYTTEEQHSVVTFVGKRTQCKGYS
jgi:hypothetical protein